MCGLFVEATSVSCSGTVLNLLLFVIAVVTTLLLTLLRGSYIGCPVLRPYHFVPMHIPAVTERVVSFTLCSSLFLK